MKQFILVVIALCSLPCLLRAQDPAPKPAPPKETAPKDTPPKDTARAFAEEFKRGYDLLIAEKWAEGMASMKRCLELVPESPLCAYNLACAHARQNQIEDALGWFEKSAAWGLGYDPFSDMIAATDKDTDLDPLRKEPRFIAAMEKVRAQTKATEDYVATPATYVPKALEHAAEMPILVVLHPSGATKDAVIASRWKDVADELGLALVAPSARMLVGSKPKQGMAWFVNVGDYVGGTRFPIYEKSVAAAVESFKSTHKVDAARVFIAGDMEGGLVALRLAFANPQTYKGVVTVDTDPITQMLQSKAASAVKAGLKVKLLVDRDSLAKRLAADPAQKADAAKVIASWTDEFTKMGYTGAVDAWSKSAPESTPAAPDPVTQKIVASLRAMQPGTVEAAAPK